MQEISCRNQVPGLYRSTGKVCRKIFLKNFVLDVRIGVKESEQGVVQPVCINLEAETEEPSVPLRDRIEDVVCYDGLAAGIRAIVSGGHIMLLETLAESIAAFVMSRSMVRAVRVRLEKPRAIDEADAAGVEISWSRDREQS